MTLQAANHDIKAYETMHRGFYNFVENRVRDMHSANPQEAERLQQQLHLLSDSESHIKPAMGVQEMCLLLSSLPPWFVSDGVRAGTIFIDSFKETHRFTRRFTRSIIAGDNTIRPNIKYSLNRYLYYICTKIVTH